MTLSYGTNNLAVIAVCKNLEFLQHLPQNQTLCEDGTISQAEAGGRGLRNCSIQGVENPFSIEPMFVNDILI